MHERKKKEKKEKQKKGKKASIKDRRRRRSEGELKIPCLPEQFWLEVKPFIGNNQSSHFCAACISFKEGGENQKERKKKKV